MNKRYQVFVSSTYADLKEERQHVIQALMEMDCIPAGMELFPAADEEQWDFIKRVIDDCGYYLLIIGGRYGSTTEAGISYTEKEYDYAIDNGLKVIALLHEKPDEISVAKSDIDPALREKLRLFREKVSNNRLVKFWSKAEQLPGMLALSLQKTIKMYPAVGWVRTNAVASEEVLTDINALRKENDALRAKLAEIGSAKPKGIENLAGLDEEFTVQGTYYDVDNDHGLVKRRWTAKTTWHEIFSIISPYLMKLPNDKYVKGFLNDTFFKKTSINLKREGGQSFDDQNFQTISIQLRALGLINTEFTQTKQGMDIIWSLTPWVKSKCWKLEQLNQKMTLSADDQSNAKPSA